jgi:phage terminase large subunit
MKITRTLVDWTVALFTMIGAFALILTFVALVSYTADRMTAMPELTPIGYVKTSIPRVFRDFTPPARYKIAYGGRGSAKSESFARLLLIRGAESRRRILCAREFQASIKDSVHQTLADIIEEYRYPYRVQRDSIVCPDTKTRFLFKGLRHNITEIKSTKGITDCFVEEAQVVSDPSWELLIPTIREPNSEIWIVFNPDLRADPTYRRFVLQPPPDAIVRKVNYSDNPFFPEVLRREMEWLRSIDPVAAEHVWDGNCREYNNAQIFAGRYTVEPFVPLPHWKGPFQGVDWGFSTDPSVMTRSYFDEENRTVYIHREAWGLQVETENLGALFNEIEGASDYTTRADNARPETISYVRRGGPTCKDPHPKMVACEKWPGSVEDGISWLKSQRIVMHPSCVHMQEEGKLYSYAIDPKTGEVLTNIVDKHNHGWDSVRYAFNPLIRAKTREYAGVRG